MNAQCWWRWEWTKWPRTKIQSKYFSNKWKYSPERKNERKNENENVIDSSGWMDENAEGHVIRKNDRLWAWIELNRGCDRLSWAYHMGIFCRRLVVEYCIWWPVFITNAYYKWHTFGAEGGGKTIVTQRNLFLWYKSKWCLAVDGKRPSILIGCRHAWPINVDSFKMPATIRMQLTKKLTFFVLEK